MAQDAGSLSAAGRAGNKSSRLVWVWATLLVLGAVVSLVGPQVQRARANDALVQCRINLKNIGTALEIYSTDNLGRYPQVLSLLVPKYLKVMPTCPQVGCDTYSVGYVSAVNADNYTLVCRGGNHYVADMPPNYPQYQPTQGLICDDQSVTPVVPLPIALHAPSRKLIKTTLVNLRVTRVALCLDRIRRNIMAAGGFMASCTFAAEKNGQKSASVEVRVPAQLMEHFVADICRMGKVLVRYETGKDVTDDFVDNHARLRNLQREESRLLDILKMAGGVRDLLVVERELARVRGDIEKIEGHLKLLGTQVEYSAVAITLSSPPPEAPPLVEDFWNLRGTVNNAWLYAKLTARFCLQTCIYMTLFLPLAVVAWAARCLKPARTTVVES